MQDFDDIDKERDLAKNREVILDDGQKMFIRQDDQYSFWTIHNAKGKVSEDLSGSYTSFNEALRAVRLYADKKLKKTIKEVNHGYGVVSNGQQQLIRI